MQIACARIDLLCDGCSAILLNPSVIEATGDPTLDTPKVSCPGPTVPVPDPTVGPTLGDTSLTVPIVTELLSPPPARAGDALLDDGLLRLLVSGLSPAADAVVLCEPEDEEIAMPLSPTV